MIIGKLRTPVDRIETAFWFGGISDSLEVIDQITYLLFLRQPDDTQALEECRERRRSNG